MTDLNQRVTTTERNAAFVNDFVFNAMSPGERATALEGGFLAERFACPPSVADCEASQQRTALIGQYRGEQRVADAVRAVGQTLQGLADISTIASNLGLNIPGLSDAVRYGSVINSAFSAFAQGNYVGAIAAATGIFAQRTDPDQERFNALMGYLSEQFQQVNAKLDEIIATQRQILTAIVDVSRQLQATYESLDAHLDPSRTRSARFRPWSRCFTSRRGRLALLSMTECSIHSMVRIATLIRSEASHLSIASSPLIRPTAPAFCLASLRRRATLQQSIVQRFSETSWIKLLCQLTWALKRRKRERRWMCFGMSVVRCKRPPYELSRPLPMRNI